jgi:hypothetical protein
MALLDAGQPEVVVVEEVLSLVEAVDMVVMVLDVLAAGDAVVVDIVVDDVLGLVGAMVVVVVVVVDVEVLAAGDMVVLVLSVVAIVVLLLDEGHMTLKTESLLSEATPYGTGIPNFRYPFVPLYVAAIQPAVVEQASASC